MMLLRGMRAQGTERYILIRKSICFRGQGGSTIGFTGDGGAATNAELSRPYGITFDSKGAMYIADYANGAVHKVTPVP